MLKRLFDIIIASILFLFFIPLLLFTALLIWGKLGRPVLFMQDRAGKDQEIFTLLKFRSMTDARDKLGKKLPDKKRITKFGSFLRSTSIDEIPSLLNVIKGDMSLVGPRPLLVKYLDRYNARQARRHEVRPGISGWAQVNGRNAISWDKKFEYDIWYIENQNFRLDLKIIGLTIIKALKQEGISANEHETMTEFKGNIKAD